MNESLASVMRCGGCHSELSPSRLSCPSCGRLVYAERLKVLAAEAEAAGESTLALEKWREALELLPPGTRQAQAIEEKIAALGKKVEDPREQAKKSPVPKMLLGLGAAGLFLWKFKFVLVFFATKGKLLLLGLTKGSTFFSMFIAFSVYLQLWGWKFALGLIGSIYVHEMGHVAALRRLGFKADAPMFIPGLGAFVRLKQRPTNPREDAIIGLAGPLWGLGATLFCLLVGWQFDSDIWLAIGRWSALINLFNLAPVFSLDGARGFAALTLKQRGLATLAVAAAWFLSGEGMLVLLLGVCVFALFRKRELPAEGDLRSLLTYSGLVLVLSMLTTVQVAL